MTIDILIEIITSFGLPIAISIVFGWFILKMFQFQKKQFIENEKERQTAVGDYIKYMQDNQEKLMEVARNNSIVMQDISIVLKQNTSAMLVFTKRLEQINSK
jgi:hypothetical protein